MEYRPEVELKPVLCEYWCGACRQYVTRQAKVNQ